MILLVAALIVLAVFSTRISSRFGIPVLLLFVGIGLVAGSDVLNLIYFDDAHLTRTVADILLIFILFDGGFRMSRASLRAVAGPSLALATAGVAITAAVLALFIHFVGRRDLVSSLLVGSIISSTDAAAVLLLTRQNPIRDRVATTLEVESASNDPMAILLTIAFIDVLAGEARTAWLFLAHLAWQLGGGILAGFLLSHAARFLFDRLESDRRGYYDVLMVGLVLLTYGLATIARANGIIAVFFMGYWLGNTSFAGKRGVGNFLDGIATSANLALFLLLGLLAFPRSFGTVWKEGLALAAVLIVVARPLAVLLCTLPFRYSWAERVFIAWGGVKGAVPIVLATYPAVYGLDSGGAVFPLIFFAVLLTCLLQGTTIGLAAKVLHLTVPRRPPSPFTVELHATRRSDLDMIEVRLRKGGAADRRRIRDLGLPPGILISSIVRAGRIVAPHGGTTAKADDLLFVLAPADAADSLSALLNGPRLRRKRPQAVKWRR